MSVRHLTLDELNAGLPHIEGSPKDHGVLRLIVRRNAKVVQSGTIRVGDLASKCQAIFRIIP